MEEYTYYQLRTKVGDGEFDYFVEYDTPYFDTVKHYIQDNELDIKSYILVKLDVVETDITQEVL